MTGGALLGIKLLRSDAEHIVALDADAVDDRTDNGPGLGRFGQAARWGSSRFLMDALSGHGRILTRRGTGSKRAGGIHKMWQVHPLHVGNH